jgi:4-amino-4-deoxy-L-arabinose transferase-like glycosyltransferase
VRQRRAPFFLCRLAQLILPTIVLAIAARLAYTNLGQYDPSYDAGVYLESARMMRRGYPLYQVIFDSQPPLWLMLVSLSFHWFGESVLAGQLVTATASLVTVAATMTATAQLCGWSGGLIAGVLVMLSPLALKWSRIVTADLPSVAFAVVGMALAARFVRSGRRPWLIAASLAATCSALVKLPGLYTFPALGLMVIARWRREPALSYRRLARAVALDSLLISGVFACATLTVMLIMGVGEVWNQVVTFHSAARAVFPSMAIGQKCRLMLGFADGERLFAYAAPFAALSVLGGLEGLAPLLWAFCTFIGLLDNRPLFDHHMVALIPPIAMAAGVGGTQFWKWSRAFLEWSRRKNNLTGSVIGIAGVLGICVGLLVLTEQLRIAWTEAIAHEAIRQQAAADSPDLKLAKLIADRTRPDDVILTDAQGIAFLAQRDVPPEMTDTSFVRIATHYLTAQEVVSLSERHHVRAVLLWTGRLNSMPEVARWAAEHFPHQESFGDGQVLYLPQ